MHDYTAWYTHALQTPCLILDRDRMQHNIDTMQARLDRLGARLRPHVKTAKSAAVAGHMCGGKPGPITVSTLKEAEAFAVAGYTDILYAVGISTDKLDRVIALRRLGVDLCVILDSMEAAAAVCAAGRAAQMAIPVLIEIDSDGHRAGVVPNDPHLPEIARVLVEGGMILRGVMTHAGSSYACRGVPALEQMAEQERAAVTTAADRLREAGFECQTVSAGSTPTASFARDLDGITEIRVGVYVFMDLVMAGLGVCHTEDIAISVLSTVIGLRPERGWILVDAGWMAMSRDRGTASQPVDQGYGLVCDLAGRPYGDLIMVEANQEHGILALRPGSSASLPDLAVGSRVRILPNHACATSAQFDRYHLLAAGVPDGEVWPRFSGW